MNRPLLQTITVYFFAGRPGGRPLQGLCVLLYGPASSTVLTLGQSTLLAGGVLVGLAAARSRSRSDSPPDCHSLRSRASLRRPLQWILLFSVGAIHESSVITNDNRLFFCGASRTSPPTRVVCYNSVLFVYGL